MTIYLCLKIWLAVLLILIAFWIFTSRTNGRT